MPVLILWYLTTAEVKDAFGEGDVVVVAARRGGPRRSSKREKTCATLRPS